MDELVANRPRGGDHELEEVILLAVGAPHALADDPFDHGQKVAASSPGNESRQGRDGPLRQGVLRPGLRHIAAGQDSVDVRVVAAQEPAEDGLLHRGGIAEVAQDLVDHIAGLRHLQYRSKQPPLAGRLDLLTVRKASDRADKLIGRETRVGQRRQPHSHSARPQPVASQDRRWRRRSIRQRQEIRLAPLVDPRHPLLVRHGAVNQGGATDVRVGRVQGDLKHRARAATGPHGPVQQLRPPHQVGPELSAYLGTRRHPPTWALEPPGPSLCPLQVGGRRPSASQKTDQARDEGTVAAGKGDVRPFRLGVPSVGLPPTATMPAPSEATDNGLRRLVGVAPERSVHRHVRGHADNHAATQDGRRCLRLRAGRKTPARMRHG